MIQMNLFTKQKQTQRRKLWLPVGNWGIWDGFVHTGIFKMGNQ